MSEQIQRDILKGRTKNSVKMNEPETMKTVHFYLCVSRISQSVTIRKIKNCLDNGGDVDLMFPQIVPATLRGKYPRFPVGTILHYCVDKALSRVAEYVISRGANIAIEITSNQEQLRYRNAVEIAASRYGYDSSRNDIFEMLRKRSLKLYSAYGLTPFLIDCSIAWKYWRYKSRRRLRNTDVNAAVSAGSPLWPGMTPLLIAAKFENYELVERLLDLGADPVCRDSEGNTPLHYVKNNAFYDERLFAFDGSNTFGPFTGDHHFHIACRNCPDALDIVKRYLDQGISPDLKTQKYTKNDILISQIANLKLREFVGLELAVNTPNLIQLLLEYGADINKLHFRIFNSCRDFNYECLSTLIEAGLNQRPTSLSSLIVFFSSLNDKRTMVECIIRLTMLDENFVSKELKQAVNFIISDSFAENWNVIVEYAERCSKELEILTDLGLCQILDGTFKLTVNSNFKRNFGWLESFDYGAYPIYGKLLRIKIKPQELLYEKKVKKIMQAVPQIQRVFQTFCHIPHLCAETILWNLSHEELDHFVRFDC